MERSAVEDVHLPVDRPPKARDSSGPRGPSGSYSPQTPPGSTRRSRRPIRPWRSTRRRRPSKRSFLKRAARIFRRSFSTWSAISSASNLSPTVNEIKKGQTQLSDESFVSSWLMAFTIIVLPYIKLDLSKTPSASFKYFSAWSRSPLAR